MNFTNLGPLLAAFLIGSPAAFAQGGDIIGNGGGIWACQNQGTLVRGTLLDVFEAEAQHHYELITTAEKDPRRIASSVMDRMRREWPQMIPTFERYMNEVLSKMDLVDLELVIINDTDHFGQPYAHNCPQGNWVRWQMAIFKKDRSRLYIQKRLWNAPEISPLDKAALLWHEAIYTWLRDAHGDKTSARARQIVGALFSTLDIVRIRDEVQKVLGAPTPGDDKWICLTQNRITNLRYIGFGRSHAVARTNAIKECKAGENGFHCDDRDLACDELDLASPRKWFCETKNGVTNVTFSSYGRSKTEARYLTLKECIDSEPNHAVHCQDLSPWESAPAPGRGIPGSGRIPGIPVTPGIPDFMPDSMPDFDHHMNCSMP